MMVINGDLESYLSGRLQDACWLCQSARYSSEVRSLTRACLDEDPTGIEKGIDGMGVFIGMNPIKGPVRG